MIIGRTDNGTYIVAAIRKYRSAPRLKHGEMSPFGAGEILTVICPFCGQTHVHGLPRGERALGAGDGHRVADCGAPGGYIVREIENPYPPEGTPIDPRRISSLTRARVMERDKFKCRRCGRGPDDGVKLEVDHVVPVSRGGHGGESNLQTLCDACNAGKGAREPHEHDQRGLPSAGTA